MHNGTKLTGIIGHVNKELNSVELARIEFEKNLEEDPNNEWLKRVIAGLKMAEQSLQRLEAIENAKSSEFKIVNYKGQYYLKINVNDDEATQIQLPLLEDEIKDVQLAIDKFKQINLANPSEALECLEDIYRNGVFISGYDASGKQYPTNISPETNKSISEQCETIKQALLKAQEQEELLDYITGFIDDVEISDNGVCYVSFENDTPYLDCIEMDEDHYNKFKKIKESQR